MVLTCYLPLRRAILVASLAVCLSSPALSQSSVPAPPISVPEARLPQPGSQLRLVNSAKARRLSSLRSPSSVNVPRIALPALSVEQLREDRRQRDLQRDPRSQRPGGPSLTRDPRPARRFEVGIVRQVELSERDGLWFDQSDGTRVWMLEVTSPGAVTVRAHVTNFNLPKGMSLSVLSPDDSSEPVEFTGKGPFGSGEFWLPPVNGDTVRLAIFDEKLDSVAGGAPSFGITGIGHLYEDPYGSIYFGIPANCELDAACYPDWNATGNPVVRILFSDPNYFYACSATLINNASGDFSPLLLTAAHCINTDTLAQTLTAYFFYRLPSCNALPPNDNTFPTSTYATFLAATTVDDSDTSLLQLLRPLPTAAVWAAWTTADPSPGDSVTSIHHPVASFQHISFGSRTTDVAAGRYGVTWLSGITEPGSSGGPLFNANRQLVGQLHGGYSTCSVAGPDSFGKLNVAYPLLTDGNGRKYLDQGLPDDNLANNSRDQAYTISVPATFNNLVVKKLTDDWFKLTVPANQGFYIQMPYVPNSTPRLEVYQGTDTTPMYSTDNGTYVGAYGGTTDFFVRVFLPFDPYYTPVWNRYDLSLSSWQPTQTSPSITTQTPTADYASAAMNGYLYMPGNPVLTSWYEWGTDPTLAVHTATPQISSSSLPPVTVRGLTPATQYYARLAVNWLGTPLYGGIVSFQTQSIGSTNYYPTPGSVGNLPQGNLSFQTYGTSADVYFGTSTLPPFLGNFIPTGGNNSVSVNAGTLNPSTRYYWQVVAKYQDIANSSALLSFDTENALKANSTALSFPSVSVAKNSDAQQITIGGQYPLSAVVASVSTEGDFTQDNNCVGATVGVWSGTAYSTCTISVTFRPTDLGPRSGTLVISAGYPLPLVIPLSGIGTPQVIVLYRPSRPARPGTGSSVAPLEVPLPLTTSARATCSVSPEFANCLLVRRDSTTVAVLVPRARPRLKRRLRRGSAVIPSGGYVLSVAEGGAHWDIPIEVQ
jgi:hypothetical protein